MTLGLVYDKWYNSNVSSHTASGSCPSKLPSRFTKAKLFFLLAAAYKLFSFLSSYDLYSFAFNSGFRRLHHILHVDSARRRRLLHKCTNRSLYHRSTIPHRNHPFLHLSDRHHRPLQKQLLESGCHSTIWTPFEWLRFWITSIHLNVFSGLL